MMNVCQKEHKPAGIVIYEDYDCPLCAAQNQVAELKARLGYIQNSNKGMFIPVGNSPNRGED